MRAIEVKLPNPCKSCGWERFQNRTECLECIRKKEREKAKVKKEKAKQKEVIRKIRKTEKKPVKKTISSLKNKADKLWSECVKINYSYKCQYCWKWGNEVTLNSHHLFTRSRNATRWDIDNWICLCAYHHTLSSEFSAHQTWNEFFIWLEWIKWRDWIDNMSKKSQCIVKLNNELVENEIILLKDFIERFK